MEEDYLERCRDLREEARANIEDLYLTGHELAAFTTFKDGLAIKDGSHLRLLDPGLSEVQSLPWPGSFGEITLSGSGRFAMGVRKANFRANNSMQLYDCVNQKVIGDLFVVEDDVLLVGESGHYMGRGDLASRLGFRYDGRGYPFVQFDLRLNRPDTILRDLGAPPEAVAAARRLREKRFRRMGVTEDMLKPDFHLPEIEILGEIPLTTDSDTLAIPVEASDSRYNLERLHIWVNNVPVNGRDGESLRSLSARRLSRNISLKLATGRNKIQISVVNSAGAESLYANLEVNCTAAAPQPALYTVALGVSSYSNPEFDLMYAAKDARDITTRLRDSTGERYRETKSLCLTDEEVTREAMPRIREFLSRAGINDTVIFFAAGHGLLDANYDYYFATTDIDFNNPGERGIAFDEFDGLMADVDSLKKTMWIDTCHAGELDEEERSLLAANNEAGAASLPGSNEVAVRSAGKRNMSVQAIEAAQTRSKWHERLQTLFVDLRRGSGTTVLASSAGAEYAYESSEQQNGLFTYALIEALRGAQAADADRKGSITISETADYVRRRVGELSNGKQNPNVRRVNLEGDFELAEKITSGSPSAIGRDVLPLKSGRTDPEGHEDQLLAFFLEHWERERGTDGALWASDFADQVSCSFDQDRNKGTRQSMQQGREELLARYPNRSLELTNGPEIRPSADKSSATIEFGFNYSYTGRGGRIASGHCNRRLELKRQFSGWKITGHFEKVERKTRQVSKPENPHKDIESFWDAHWRSYKSQNQHDWASLFAATSNYCYGNAQTPRNLIATSRRELIDKYPRRSYQLESAPRYREQGNGGIIEYVYRYSYQGPRHNAAGRAKVTLGVQQISGSWLITDYQESVLRK